MAACSGGVSPRRPRGSLSAPLGGAAGRGSRNGKRDLVARRKVFLPCSSLPSLVPGAGGAMRPFLAGGGIRLFVPEEGGERRPFLAGTERGRRPLVSGGEDGSCLSVPGAEGGAWFPFAPEGGRGARRPVVPREVGGAPCPFLKGGGDSTGPCGEINPRPLAGASGGTSLLGL